MKYNETLISKKNWDKLFKTEYYLPDGSLNVAKIRTDLYLYNVLQIKCSEVYAELTDGEISDPQTEPEMIIDLVEDLQDDLNEYIAEQTEIETIQRVRQFGAN